MRWLLLCALLGAAATSRADGDARKLTWSPEPCLFVFTDGTPYEEPEQYVCDYMRAQFHDKLQLFDRLALLRQKELLDKMARRAEAAYAVYAERKKIIQEISSKKPPEGVSPAFFYESALRAVKSSHDLKVCRPFLWEPRADGAPRPKSWERYLGYRDAAIKRLSRRLDQARRQFAAQKLADARRRIGALLAERPGGDAPAAGLVLPADGRSLAARGYLRRGAQAASERFDADAATAREVAAGSARILGNPYGKTKRVLPTAPLAEIVRTAEVAFESRERSLVASRGAPAGPMRPKQRPSAFLLHGEHWRLSPIAVERHWSELLARRQIIVVQARTWIYAPPNFAAVERHAVLLTGVKILDGKVAGYFVNDPATRETARLVSPRDVSPWMMLLSPH